MDVILIDQVSLPHLGLGLKYISFVALPILNLIITSSSLILFQRLKNCKLAPIKLSRQLYETFIVRKGHLSWEEILCTVC